MHRFKSLLNSQRNILLPSAKSLCKIEWKLGASYEEAATHRDSLNKSSIRMKVRKDPGIVNSLGNKGNFESGTDEACSSGKTIL